MKGSCHCGAVSLNVPARPDYLNQCNCTACAKLGTLWGYYLTDAVTIEGSPLAYARVDSDPPMLHFNFCGSCGATTHWSPTEHHPIDRLGVNMRLFEPDDLIGLEVRYGDRRNHAAAEPRQYCRAPTIFQTGAVA